MMPEPFEAPPGYHDLLARLWKALGFPGRRPLLIGIDGRDGAGKTPLSSWLAWQLGIPAVYLDLYVVPGRPVDWRRDDLDRLLAARLDRRRLPLIVEGVLLLDALDNVGRSPDFLIFVKREGNEGSYALAEEINAYLVRRQPQDRADHRLSWSSAEYDRREEKAALAGLISTSG